MIHQIQSVFILMKIFEQSKKIILQLATSN